MPKRAKCPAIVHDAPTMRPRFWSISQTARANCAKFWGDVPLPRNVPRQNFSRIRQPHRRPFQLENARWPEDFAILRAMAPSCACCATTWAPWQAFPTHKTRWVTSKLVNRQKLHVEVTRALRGACGLLSRALGAACACAGQCLGGAYACTW